MENVKAEEDSLMSSQCLQYVKAVVQSLNWSSVLCAMRKTSWLFTSSTYSPFVVSDDKTEYLLYSTSNSGSNRRNNKTCHLLDSYDWKFVLFFPFYKLGTEAVSRHVTCSRSHAWEIGSGFRFLLSTCKTPRLTPTLCHHFAMTGMWHSGGDS